METDIVTKKEIVKKISEDIGLTQLKTKDIVQRTLDAIIHTLVSEGRIELRNFGVFEVKRLAPRKARNPRTGDKVFEREDVKLFCDLKSYIYLNGTVLDFDSGLMGKGFVFMNPNAKKSCGCGSSFST